MLLFVAVALGYNQYWSCGFMFLLFYVQEHPKAQRAVALVLKRLRRRGTALSLIQQVVDMYVPCTPVPEGVSVCIRGPKKIIP